MYERCIGEWKLGLELNSPTQLTRPEVAATIRDKFLPKFFGDFGDIWLKRKKDLRPLPADFWVAVVESHLSGPMGPVRELRDYLDTESAHNKAFDARLRSWMASEQQWNFNRNDPQSWRDTVDRFYDMRREENRNWTACWCGHGRKIFRLPAVSR